MTVLPDDGLSLAAEFPDATHEQWQRLVEGVLRKSGKEVSGAEAEDALSTELEDGLRTRPLYTAPAPGADPGGPEAGVEPEFPGHAPFSRGGRAEGNVVAGWDVRQRLADPDPARLNEAVLADLENGTTSLWLPLDAGASQDPAGFLDRALRGVYLDLAPVVLEPHDGGSAPGRALLGLWEARGTAPEEARGTLGVDWLGREARTGIEADPAVIAEGVALAAEVSARLPHVRTLVVDALPYHEAGASPSWELALSLASGVAALRALTEGGALEVPAALGQLEFRYAADGDQFLTIAKLRAARRLWARVAESCGAAEAGAQRQHAVTSSVMMTRRDPWVNMLRTTIATLAAGVGGADAVTVLPFDSELGASDAFARRIARNTSTVLVRESHLARVIDPAGGSWYVEELTDRLAETAWGFFQEVEAAGGLPAALRSGLVRERLAAGWARRSRRLATRREPITGVSEFPFLAEKPVERPAPVGGPVRAGRPGGLPVVRRDEAYEELRARSDAHLAATGARPRVFLAALGPAAAHTARASFASNLFQAGGIEPVHDPVSVDAEGAGAAYAASGADGVAVLCSSDALYEESAAGVAAALRAAGARTVFLAGRPGTAEGAVDAWVFAGCDAPAVLGGVLDGMGVAR
ncbi:methylmalonyl-CoA mutase family protein [Streptomyces sp. BI20]|uniref:methylmalonyl-CoA mutase family protein n=1 Tax=Streptomyces sp. BI20 TaxID=3403460 RepID=UPI003C738A3A